LAAPQRKAITKTKEVAEPKDDILGELIVDLNKQFKDSTQLLDDSYLAQVCAWVPSGNPVLDTALGNGWPCGRIVEIYGPESHGKTTVALHIVAEVQKLNGIAVYLDTEYALKKDRAKAIGVDLKRLIYANPETMEDLFEYVEMIIDKIRAKDPNRLVVIVWDSVAATPTKSEVEGDYGDAVMGIHARVMSQAFRKITKKIATNKIMFVCINQIRDKMNVSYGDKTSTFGGRALKFYASIRLEVQKIGMYREPKDGPILGIQCKATCKKNKVAPPFRDAEFNILFDEEHAGIDAYGSVTDVCKKMGLLGDSQGWYAWRENKFQGKAKFVDFLREHPEEWKALVDTYTSIV
jgi:recombination protein RecA